MGTVIDRKYTLIEKISEGGGGTVWKAKSPDSDEKKEVALKILKWASLSKSKTATTERFKREFELFKKVSHPNIAKIYDFGLDAEKEIYYFTSELLLGGDLRKMIGAPIDVIENLLLQALRTLEYLKNFGILHLDIKPHNLLLRTMNTHPSLTLPTRGRELLRPTTDDRRPTSLALIDFGLAGFNPPERPGGTPNYMSPEAVAKRLGGKLLELDHRSDIYSLGVTFYYILSGVLPFAVSNTSGNLDAEATMQRHLENKPIAPPSKYRADIPGYLDAIIMRMVASKPSDRYQTAMLASQALCFRSPNKLEPETKETINAYLPEEGLLIGRHKEIKILEDSLKAVAVGMSATSQVICISGRWGTGKTRLLKSLIPTAQQMEMEVFTNLRSRHPDFLRPTVFLIDDPLSSSGIESSSVPDIFALKHIIKLVRRVPNAKSFLAFTINTDLISLDNLFNTLEMDRSSCQIIELKNFTIEEVTEYAAHLLGEAPSVKIVEELHRTTFGNPKFIADLFKRMIEKGELFSFFSGRPGSEVLASIDFSFSQTTSPPSLSEYFLEIVQGLTDSAAELVYYIACWRHGISINELEGISGKKDIDGELAVLITSGLVKLSREAAGIFYFSNPLAAKIIEASLDPEKRIRIHDNIANYLRRHFGSPSPLVGEGGGEGATFELDRHLAFGSDKKLKNDAAKRFAVKSLERLHPAEAAEVLDDLFGTFSVSEWDAASEVLIREGQAYARVGRFNEAWNVFEKLRGLSSNEATVFELNLRADEQQGFLALRMRKLNEAKEIFTRALKSCHCEPRRNAVTTPSPLVGEGQGEGGGATTIRLKNRLAGVDLREGNYEKAASVFRQTAKEAAKLSLELKKQITNNELGETLLYMGKVDEAIKIITADLKWAREINHLERIINQLRLLGDANRRMGKSADAHDYYKQALELCRKHYFFENQLRVQNSLANLLLQMGKWDEAIAEYRPALDLAMRLEGKATSVDIISNIGIAYNKLEKFDDAIEYLELALDFAKGPESESSAQIKNELPSIHVALGHANYEKKRFDKAREHLNAALELGKEQNIMDVTLYNLHGTLAEIDLATGKPKDAKKRLPTLKKLATKIPEAAAHLKELTKQIEDAL